MTGSGFAIYPLIGLYTKYEKPVPKIVPDCEESGRDKQAGIRRQSDVFEAGNNAVINDEV
jgi:hypothetical protein